MSQEDLFYGLGFGMAVSLHFYRWWAPTLVFGDQLIFFNSRLCPWANEIKPSKRESEGGRDI